MFRTCSRSTRSRRALWLNLVAGVVLWGGPLHAPVRAEAGDAAPSDTTSATSPAPASSAPDPVPPPGEPVADAPGASALDAIPTPREAASAAPDPGVAQVQRALADLAEERAHTSRLLPWLTVGVGVGTVLAAAGTGAGYALTCEASCESPNWMTLTVVVGATIATLGAIWVVQRDADIRELESRRYQLEQDLLRLRLGQPAHAAALSGSRPLFSLRFRL